MQIGLLGYGKMGRAIETIAQKHGHRIAWRITRENRQTLSPELLCRADVVIEFTRPDSAYANVMACLEAGVPVVCGTTGWLEQLADAETWCAQHKGALLWASNFSVGVNLFFALNRFLAQLMDERPEYRPDITEIHHVHKLDAPSGTARTLAQDILAQLKRLDNWSLFPTPPGPGDLPITAVREGEVPGTHTVSWSSPVDEITIEHRAHSRTGFAAGAVLAAEWLAGKTGVYRMEDVLGI
ncbi:MAG: 4-hydroxy-tetrahydrodipicolinate reductase [Saprospiraceae bacterium]|jgi:4-hydroxy-tetrahydrodipicolinate reductase|nr:4-hydroxy-tetrahydrodipicolinate reductase [Saprospiraceae bacterium]